MSGPTFNFYNCCCGGETQTGMDGHLPPSSATGAVFPFKTTNGNVTAFWNSGVVDRTTPYNYSSNIPQNLTPVFNNMESHPLPFEIKSLSLIKGGEHNTSTEQLNMDLIVSDYAGNVLCTISTQPIDVIAAPPSGLDANFPQHAGGRSGHSAERTCRAALYDIGPKHRCLGRQLLCQWPRPDGVNGAAARRLGRAA